MRYLLWGLSDGSEIELSGDSRDPAVRSQVTSELIWPGVHGILRTHVGPWGSMWVQNVEEQKTIQEDIQSHQIYVHVGYSVYIL